MAYATIEDYGQYGNGTIPSEDVGRYLARASDEVDGLTFNRIVGQFEILSTFRQLLVLKAVCLQAEFIYSYGEYVSAPLASFSAGSISVSFQAATGGGSIKTTDAVLNLLRQTGLAQRSF